MGNVIDLKAVEFLVCRQCKCDTKREKLMIPSDLSCWHARDEGHTTAWEHMDSFRDRTLRFSSTD